MTTTELPTAGDERSAEQHNETFGAFSGNFVPGLCFGRGYCVWLLAFTDTPTRFDAYAELWIITPEGERVLDTDPEPATAEVRSTTILTE